MRVMRTESNFTRAELGLTLVVGADIVFTGWEEIGGDLVYKLYNGS